MGSSSTSLFEFWIFFFKVSLSGECSVLACLVAGPGLALPPASSNRLLISGAGIAAAATPNVGKGAHTANQLRPHLQQAQQRTVIVLNRGLVVVNSRKVPNEPRADTLPVDNLNEDPAENKHRVVVHSEVSLDHRDLV